MSLFFFFNDTATTEIYTLSLHDALPICPVAEVHVVIFELRRPSRREGVFDARTRGPADARVGHFDAHGDRKSTRLNSSHQIISYAVFCLKKKKTDNRPPRPSQPSHSLHR